MKSLNLFLLLILCNQISSQNLPNINNVLTIKPEWINISEDTNWYRIQLENNLHLDQYFGSLYSSSLVKDDNYYLLEFAVGQTHSPPLTEGYFLRKIDLNNGLEEWVHFDNFYSGNEFVESVFGGNMHFDQDGKIVVNGFKSLDSIKNITFEDFNSRVYVNVMRDVIDDNNGQLLDHRVDLDTSRTINKLHPGGFGIKKVSNNRQIKQIFNNVFEDGLVRNYLHFYDVDEMGVVSHMPSFSYKHTTIVDFDAPFLSYPNTYLQLNEDTGVALFGTRDQSQGNIPIELKLVFFDLSNSPDIVVTEERSVHDLMPQNLDIGSGYVSLRGKNGSFFLSQKARIEINANNFDDYIWIQWYDSSGNPIQKIDRLQFDGLNADFMSSFTFVDNSMYILCRKRDGGPLGGDLYYLIRSDENTNSEVISSFVKLLSFKNHDVGFSEMKILENNDVLFYMNVNYPYGPMPPYKANVSYLCRYDGKDLGLITNVVDEEMTETMFISPNPAIDYILLNDISNQTIRDISIVDVLGNTRSNVVLEDNKLDISDLIPGSYFVKFYQNGKMRTLPFVKI